MSETITSDRNIALPNGKLNKLEKSPTGIRGLDEITYGGIPQNRPTILVGGTGTGKTFLSMEYIIKGAVKFNEPGVFMTFEEKQMSYCLTLHPLATTCILY